MSAAVERALLTLFAATNPDDFNVDQRNQLGLGVVLDDDFGPANALSIAAAAVAPESLSSGDDRFAATQAFYLGVQYQRIGGDVEHQLRELATSLLRSVGSDASIVAGDPPRDPARILVGTFADLAPGELVTQNVVDDLVSAFGPELQITRSADQWVFAGPAAALATLLLEFFTNKIRCHTKTGTIDVKGVPTEVVFVEVDVCTNQPFDHCAQGIDPRHWPRCNPYFLSVRVLQPVTHFGDGWSAIIKEKVGCPFNGIVYETDLAVTMVEQTGLSAVAFDLAPNRTDPGLVSVDRGFLSATDEGDHRRIRVLKVYRIENLQFPHLWICPIWASQVAMSAWWCP